MEAIEYRVTTYKVAEALKSGITKSVEDLVNATRRPEHEVRAVLVQMFPNEFGTPGLDVAYRTEPTLEELVKYAREIMEYGGIQAIVDWKVYAHACCCTGPQNGEPLCPCSMQVALVEKKVAVLNEINPEIALQVFRKDIIDTLKI